MRAMKKNTYQTIIFGASHVNTSLAVALSPATLSNQEEGPLGVAACSFEIQAEEPWQEILPGEDFTAFDGRPFEVPGNQWKINNESDCSRA